MEILKVYEKLLNYAYQRNWDRKLAKGGYTKETSLLNHSYSTAAITYDLLKLINEKSDLFSEKEIEIAVISSFLHDLDKELDAFQRKIKGEKGVQIEHLPTFEKFSLNMKDLGYSEMDAKYAYACLLHTHLETGETITVSSIKSELYQTLKKEEKDTSNISWIGEIIRLADWFSSSNSPSEVKQFVAKEDIASLINDLGLNFAFFELSIIRGRLSYFLLDAAEKAFREQNFVPVVNYPQGMVGISNSEKIDEEKFIQSLTANLKESLMSLILQENFLKNNLSMVINRSMIGSEDIIGIQSFEEILKLGRAQLKENIPSKKSKKEKSKDSISNKEKNEALLLRLIISLISSFKEKVQKNYPDEKEKLCEKIDKYQLKWFGFKIDEIGKTQEYHKFLNVLYETVSPHLIKIKETSRKLNELEENDSLNLIENIGRKFFSEVKQEFKNYEKLSVTIDQYLNPLLNDIQIPKPRGDLKLFELVTNAYQTYLNAKDNAVGSIKNKIRCPICGTSQEGVEAKKANVGAGTKKFTNLYKGYKALNNVNICKLCVIEGTLRSGGQESFFELIYILSLDIC